MEQVPRPGRPEATSHAAIEAAAFRLFSERGFDATTLDAIADAVGVSRRTLFRYFESKNDIPWGQFDRTLDGFRAILAAIPDTVPLADAVQQGVLVFNEFDDDADPPHRERMRLILETPTLQAHSVLRYAEWREVIAEYVATRTGLAPTDTLPRTVGSVSLALAISAYEGWLADPGGDLAALLDETMASLRSYLASPPRTV
ncbi:mycofactocin system transcriptional regulator [Nocardioides hankookensis]|uniref:Mycofactocin system transcriptional regulator n=1 Tax=Nocardioides hankookensis TaxID=443157 RepID=A0ABW1LEK3_9ACTN